MRLPAAGAPRRRPARAARAPAVRGGACPTSPRRRIGAIGLRAAGGFLIFLLAFALRSAEVPAYWFAVLAAAGVVGGFLVDMAAPTLPRSTPRGVDRRRLHLGGGRGRAARLAALRPAAAGRVRVHRGRRDRARAPGDAEPGPARRAGRRARAACSSATRRCTRWRGSAPRSSRRSCRSRSGKGCCCSSRFYAALGAAFWWRWRRALGPRRALAHDLGYAGRLHHGRRQRWRSRRSAPAAIWARARSRRSTSGGAEIAVARVGGTLYAFSDICTHRRCNLANGGEIDGTSIECECHGSVFSMETGEVLALAGDRADRDLPGPRDGRARSRSTRDPTRRRS